MAPVKYLLDLSLAVRILGPVYGALFLSLMLASLRAVARLRRAYPDIPD